jgi:hypothetical protein
VCARALANDKVSGLATEIFGWRFSKLKSNLLPAVHFPVGGKNLQITFLCQMKWRLLEITSDKPKCLS